MAKRDKKKIATVPFRQTFLDMTKLPDFLLLKPKRGGIVVLTCGCESQAKELYTAIKTKFENKDFHTVVGGNFGAVMSKKETNMSKGSSLNIAEMNMTMYGSMNPNTEILRGAIKEMFEAAMPKYVASKPFGTPMIFGTGGGMSGTEYFRRMCEGSWMNEPMPKMVGWVERHEQWLKENPPMPYDPNEMIDKEKFTEMFDKLNKQ